MSSLPHDRVVHGDKADSSDQKVFRGDVAEGQESGDDGESGVLWVLHIGVIPSNPKNLSKRISLLRDGPV